MSEKLHCQEVRETILSMSDDEGKHACRPISDHLAECEACRRLHIACQKVDQILAEEKMRLLTFLGQNRPAKEELLARISSRPPRRALWHLRPAWAGAVAILLAVAGASAVYFLKRGGGESQDRIKSSAPMVTHSMAAAASYETVGELVNVVTRHEAPSSELPYTPPMAARESFVPGLLQRTVTESEDTLSMILGSRTRLTRREET